ncbi:hypothetical protein FRC01_005063, partial [Tulasnella sp. 417]
LGRQWLVYYRKRSGGGPDRQRWEQLKRFLGAQRWRLELILDDVLPALLQTGLVVFCVSLVIYLHHLSATISIIVGIPISIGLAALVGSAMCTLWDRFCPFHSPLSHLLCWIFHNVPPMMGVIKVAIVSGFQYLRNLALQFIRGSLRVARLIHFWSRRDDDAGALLPLNPTAGGMGWPNLWHLVTVLPGASERWLGKLRSGRTEESMESLQVIALSRTICTSDDPATLMYATANIFSIKTVPQMEQLWSDEAFQERFRDQLLNSDTRMMQLRGRDRVNFAVPAKRLHCAAMAHVVLFLDTSWSSILYMGTGVRGTGQATMLVPDQELPDSPAYLLQATVGFTVLQFCFSLPSRATIQSILGHLVNYSNRLEQEDWRLFCVISWVASMLPMILDTRKFWMDSWMNWLIGPLRKAYRGDVDEAFQTAEKAFEVLCGAEWRGVVDCDRFLTNLLRYVNQMVFADMKEAGITIAHKFGLLEKLHMGYILIEHLEHLRIMQKNGDAFHESTEILQAFGLPLRRLLERGPDLWIVQDIASTIRVDIRNAFNNLVAEMDCMSHRVQVRVHVPPWLFNYLTFGSSHRPPPG